MLDLSFNSFECIQEEESKIKIVRDFKLISNIQVR